MRTAPDRQQPLAVNGGAPEWLPQADSNRTPESKTYDARWTKAKRFFVKPVHCHIELLNRVFQCFTRETNAECDWLRQI